MAVVYAIFSPGKKPKDFDVTTNATPDQVRKLFRNCRLVGRRFRLAHVMFGPEIIEVGDFPRCIMKAANPRSHNIAAWAKRYAAA